MQQIDDWYDEFSIETGDSARHEINRKLNRWRPLIVLSGIRISAPVSRRTMPIKVPDTLPALVTLEAEGVVLMRETDAARQNIRPLRIGLLNLMPNKPRTETQFARLLGATPLQVELSLVHLASHTSRNTPAEHLAAFYRTWAEVANEHFDGFIITGAPVETLPFEHVSYWDELRHIFDWTQAHVHSCLTICWSAQAALWHFHGIGKHVLRDKRSGVYTHRLTAPSSPYLRGMPDEIDIPVSRWSEVRPEDLPPDAELKLLLTSDEAGLCLIEDPARRALHMFNHLEYDSMTLADEFARDRAKNPATPAPANYFPEGNPERTPKNRWRGDAHLLFTNWINQIYQTIPFDLGTVGVGSLHSRSGRPLRSREATHSAPVRPYQYANANP